jgi:hypothetical protein
VDIRGVEILTLNCNLCFVGFMNRIVVVPGVRRQRVALSVGSTD